MDKLVFLASKSDQLLEKQIAAYRQKQSNSGILITILTIFIPFFLDGMTDASITVKCFAVLPLLLIVIAIIFLVLVLKNKPMSRGLNVNKIQDIVNNSYMEILTYEIGANVSSFNDNTFIARKIDKNYNIAINLTIASIFLSSFLLLGNEFSEPAEQYIKVIIVNK